MQVCRAATAARAGTRAQVALMKFQSMRLLCLAALCGAGLCAPAFADKIKHPTAVFAGLDKITGRIISFEVAVDETVQFGSLQVTARACFTRPATEAPQTTTFVEVEEAGANKEYKPIFGGWMYAASPGLHGIEHPVYDIWLTDCKGGTEVIKTGPEVADLPPQGVPATLGTPGIDDVRTPKPGTVPLPKPKKPPVADVTPRPPPPVAVAAPPAPKPPTPPKPVGYDPTLVGKDPANRN